MNFLERLSNTKAIVLGFGLVVSVAGAITFLPHVSHPTTTALDSVHQKCMSKTDFSSYLTKQRMLPLINGDADNGKAYEIWFSPERKAIKVEFTRPENEDAKPTEVCIVGALQSVTIPQSTVKFLSKIMEYMDKEDKDTEHDGDSISPVDPEGNNPSQN